MALNFFSTTPKIVLDMGTATTLLLGEQKNILFYEPTAVVVDDREQALYTGEAAAAITYDDQVARHAECIRQGKISDEAASGMLLDQVLSSVRTSTMAKILPRSIALSVPLSFSERDAYVWKKMGNLRGVSFSFVPTVVGITESVTADQAQVPTMVLDMGAGKIDIALVDFHTVVHKKTLQFAGISLSTLYALTLFEQYGLSITTADALHLVQSVGVLGNAKQSAVVMRGKDRQTGRIGSLKVTKESLLPPITQWLTILTNAVLSFVAELPTSVIAMIERDGITIAGALAQMSGLEEALRERTKLRFHTAPRPALAGALGISTLLHADEPHTYTVH